MYYNFILVIITLYLIWDIMTWYTFMHNPIVLYYKL